MNLNLFYWQSVTTQIDRMLRFSGGTGMPRSIINLRMKAAVSGYAIARFDVYFGLNGAGLAKRAASMAAFERTSASSIMFCPLVQVTRM